MNGVTEGGWAVARVRKVIVNCGAGNDVAELFIPQERLVTVRGGAGNDVIVSGGGAKNAIYGGGGRDRIFAGGTYSVIHGDANADTLSSGADEQQTLYGGGGNDRFIANRGIATFVGGPGIDSIVPNKTTDAVAVVIDLSRPDQSGFHYGPGHGTIIVVQDDQWSFTGGTWHITGIEIAVGTDGSDLLAGSPADNTLLGGAGPDTLWGNGGHDTADDDPLDERHDIDTLT